MDIMNHDPEKAVKPAQVFWCAAAGIALTLAFPGAGADWCAWFAPAFLLAGLRGASPARAGLLGLTAGLVHFLTLLYWLVPTMHAYGPMPLVLSACVLVLLAFYLSLYVGAFCFLVAFCSAGRLSSPLWCMVTVPVFWVSMEWARGNFFTGFPWGILGYSQYSRLYLIQIADISGIYGISFMLAAAGAAVFLAAGAAAGLKWAGRLISGRHAAVAAAAVLVMAAAAAGYGKVRIDQTDRAAADAGKMRVALIQGNIEQSLKWDEKFAEKTVKKYISLTGGVLEQDPDLVVWPETALPFYFHHDRKLTRMVLDAAEKSGTYLLTGSPAYDNSQKDGGPYLYNSAYLIDPKGREAGRYDKVHLVPFGEYVPLRSWLPFLGTMVPQQADFSAGSRGQVLDRDGMLLGVQICYEMIFPGLSAAMARQGADLIVNITNDAWFGRTAAPYQHFSMGVLRAVENRRAFVRAANTGISGLIGPAGRIGQASEIFETEALTASVPLIRGENTFYSACGDVFALLCSVLALALAAAGFTARRKGLRKTGDCW